ncbi:22764_t:CDS:2 [Cetraspora pellucida]|uniref:22764_t:CDS:1 n=1 Tax=Cetraspora pellucida TaxID=1433469 RepID=A0A9N9DW17_9GLOM|nr:22764_t:CDS:2 [Cetraspora pellucida]
MYAEFKEQHCLSKQVTSLTSKSVSMTNQNEKQAYHKGFIKSQFPILSEMTQKFLAIPATSTPSECLFSDAGNVMSVKRTLLKPKLFDRMVFLKRNMKEIDFIIPDV